MADHSYKSDLEAAMARARALEAENKRLRDQLSGEQEPSKPSPRRFAWTLVLVAFILFGFGLLGGLVPLAGARGAMLAVAVIIALGVPLLVVRKQLHLCQPNEALIISGRRYRAPDGSARGYRVISSGSVLAVPLLERVDRLDLTAHPLEATVNGAYSKGGLPLRIVITAAVKISSDPHLISNAVERFLGRAPAEIVTVARETLEGCLRSVVAMLEPEEIQADRLYFAQKLHEEAAGELDRLGLQIDGLAIQEIEAPTP